MATQKHYDLFWDELSAVTIDVDSDDGEEECHDALCADVEAKHITDEVIAEALDCLDRDWCDGRVKIAFLEVLAENGALEEFNQNTIYSWRPKTKVINGKRYLI